MAEMERPETDADEARDLQAQVLHQPFDLAILSFLQFDARPGIHALRTLQIGNDRPKPVGERGHDVDRIRHRLSQRRQNSAYDIAEIDQFGMRRLPARQYQQLSRQGLRSLERLEDLDDVGSRGSPSVQAARIISA